jgi:hypothetical protein
MRCPVLSDVAAAEFEARAKVDLSARSTRGGELEVACETNATHLRWRQKGGAWWARSIAPASPPAAFVDGLLRTSEELVEESLRFEGEGAPKEQPALPDPAQTGANATPDGGADPKAPAEPQKPPRDAEPQPDPVAKEERVPGKDPLTSSSRAGTTWIWGVTAGLDAALFGRNGAAIGPHAGLIADLPDTLALQLTGEYGFGIGAGDAVTVRMAGASAVIAKRFGRTEPVELAAGIMAGGVFASAIGSVQPSSLAELYGGALARVRLGFRQGAWRFAGGPELRFYTAQPAVAVDHNVVWSVPEVSVGFGLEVSFDITGPR